MSIMHNKTVYYVYYLKRNTGHIVCISDPETCIYTVQLRLSSQSEQSCRSLIQYNFNVATMSDTSCQVPNNYILYNNTTPAKMSQFCVNVLLKSYIFFCDFCSFCCCLSVLLYIDILPDCMKIYFFKQIISHIS